MSLRLMARVVPDQVQVSADAFRTLFALPHARLVAATSLVARLPKGMVLLSVVLLLRQTSGSYAIAGVTAAAVAVGDAVSTPAQGRLLDRFSRGRVLIPSAALNVAAISAVIVLAGRGAPADVVAAIACLAGIGMPPVSGSVKAVWPQLAGQDRLPAAYAMESLLQQVVFLSGPLLVTVLAAAGGPAAALACSAVLVAAGTVGFVLAAAAAVPSAETRPDHRAHGAWRVATVRVLVCSTLLQSLVFGALPGRACCRHRSRWLPGPGRGSPSHAHDRGHPGYLRAVGHGGQSALRTAGWRVRRDSYSGRGPQREAVGGNSLRDRCMPDRGRPLPDPGRRH
jgi:MFS family permease